MQDLRPLLSPKAVALIGASPDRDNLRGRILEVMRSHPFAGPIYPVSRTHREVQGVAAYPSVAELPGPVDLAVIIIPAEHVPEELERCAAAGIKAALILSSGFAEVPGARETALQDEIRRIARRHGIVVCGPNSEGFANTAAALCPTFSPAMHGGGRALVPQRQTAGRVAVISQSGGIGYAFYDRGRPKEMAFSYIVTTGNEASLEAADVLEYLIEEGQTDAFILLVEDIRTPDTFRRAAEKALRAGKPLIVSKIGQSDAGRRAALSHTGALAGSHDAYRAVFERYGVVESSDLEEAVDLAQGFLTYRTRLPAGKRVGICASSGGACGWLADAAQRAGLEIPELDRETRALIDVHLPSYGTSQNPVDATAQTVFGLGPAEVPRLIARSPLVDAVIVGTTAVRSHGYKRDRKNLLRLAQETAKPILLWTYTLPAAESVAILSEVGLPLFTNMHNCTRTLAAMADHRMARERFMRPAELCSPERYGRYEAAAALAAGSPALPETEAKAILVLYGIRGMRGERLVQSAEEAAAVAAALARPVALKVQSPDIMHKSEAGALELGLASPQQVRAAYPRVLDRARGYAPVACILGVLVQPMAPPGIEMIVGVRRDERFGPMLMVGLGGIHVEVLKDFAMAPVPLSADEAHALVAKLKGARLLAGHRGIPPADVTALVDLMVRLSQFAADHGEVLAEIDLNPVIVHAKGDGVSVADALIVKRE